MEEVVEDIEDEHDAGDEPDQFIQQIGERDYIVNARIELDELCEQLQIELPKGNYVTLAGLVLDKARSVPSRGTVIEEQGITLTVHRSSARAVLEVRIHW